MGQRGSSPPGRAPGFDGRGAQNRTRIAQMAAKLIAEHGIADWTLAKRKAVRQLMLPEREALRWMRRLTAFEPLLVGGVAAGWATAHSDIRLELTAADAKLVELALLNAGISYRAMHADRDGAAELYVDTPSGGVRLSVRGPADARQRPRRDRHGNEEIRLDEAAVAALLS